MEYIAFIEDNNKERETFVAYLQYTGNEVELAKLYECVNRAKNRYVYGDLTLSTFEMSMTRITEDAVNQHCNLPFGKYGPMFYKVNGRFTCRVEVSDRIAYDLYEMFSSLRIESCFSYSP